LFIYVIVPVWNHYRPQDFDPRTRYVEIPDGLEYIATADNHDYGYSCDTCHKFEHQNSDSYLIAGSVVIPLTGIGQKGLEIQAKEGCKGCHDNKDITNVTRKW
jgi:hypothetical protein